MTEAAAGVSAARGEGSDCAEDILLSLHAAWYRNGRRRTLLWQGSVSQAKRCKRDLADQEEMPDPKLQILRALAALTLLCPDDEDQGYSVLQIATFGLGLFPGSSVFEQTDGRVTALNTEAVAAEIRAEGPEGLRTQGCIWSVPPSEVTPEVLTRDLRVFLTPRGAYTAIGEERWVPPLPGYMQTLLARAARRMSFGHLKLA